MYAFGAMLSFTIAHVSVIELRVQAAGDRGARFRARPNLRVARRRLAAVRDPRRARRRPRRGSSSSSRTPATRWAGLGWLAVGFVFYAVYRRYVVHAPLRETVARAGRCSARRSRSSTATSSCRSSRGASRRRRSTSPAGSRPSAARRSSARQRRDRARSSCRSTPTLPEAGGGAPTGCSTTRARSASSTASDVIERLVRARSAGRAIVEEAERRQSEIVVLGAPRADRARGGRLRQTVDYVLKHAPVPRDGRGRAQEGRCVSRSTAAASTALSGARLRRRSASRCSSSPRPRRRRPVGYLLGVLFIALGAGRLYLLRGGASLSRGAQAARPAARARRAGRSSRSPTARSPPRSTSRSASSPCTRSASRRSCCSSPALLFLSSRSRTPRATAAIRETGGAATFVRHRLQRPLRAS